MKAVLIVFACLFCVSCTNAGAALEALESQGMTDIQITGWAPLSCSQQDFSSTGFKAVNPNGKAVKGVVCCGLVFKSCTIRW